MTLAVMTRASLGHTGHELVAGSGTQAIYAAVGVAACARVTGALLPAWTLALLHVAALAWIAAFGGFAVLYGPSSSGLSMDPDRIPPVEDCCARLSRRAGLAL